MSTPTFAFSISRDRLASAMSRVAKVVEKRNTIQILDNVLMRADSGTVTLRATNLDIEASVVVDGAAIGAAGAITVPAGAFNDALAKWPDGTLTVESDGRRVTARVARSRATLPVLPAEDFPDIRHNKRSDITFQIPGSDLMAMRERCGFAMGEEETRHYLMGMYLHAYGERLWAAATDGHRLSRFEMPMPEGAEDLRGVIIPRETIKHWHILLGKDQSEPVTIEVAESFIRFSTDIMTLHSKVTDGTYPDYLRVIPRGNNQIAIAGLTDLAKSVERLNVLRDDKRGKGLKLHFLPGEIRLTITTDTSEAEEVIPAACDFELEIGFNGKYLSDMLGTMSGAHVRIATADPGSPCVVTDETDPRRELVLMPMRV